MRKKRTLCIYRALALDLRATVSGLYVLNDYNRQLLGVEIDFSLPAARVVQTLMRFIEQYSCPAQLRTDNGPNFSSAQLSEWHEKQGIILQWIQPGKPPQTACIERFNGSFRRALLDTHLFRSLDHVRQLVNAWMLNCNTLTKPWIL